MEILANQNGARYIILGALKLFSIAATVLSLTGINHFVLNSGPYLESLMNALTLYDNSLPTG